jgi:hypothetical protein
MNYMDLILRIKMAASADEDESQDALELVVENVAAHLTDRTRREFAAALPDELQSAAQMVPTANHIDEDIIEQLMDLEDVDESNARKRIPGNAGIFYLVELQGLKPWTSSMPWKRSSQLSYSPVRPRKYTLSSVGFLVVVAVTNTITSEHVAVDWHGQHKGNCQGNCHAPPEEPACHEGIHGPGNEPLQRIVDDDHAKDGYGIGA